MNILENKTARFLIDSGSSISLIKVKSLLDEVLVNQKTILNLSGIGSGTIKTLGTCQAEINLNENVLLNHLIHVVKSDFPIDYDGIIGQDILTKFSSYKIDHLKNVFRIEMCKNSFEIKLCNDKYFFTIPKRSQLFLKVPMDMNKTSISILKSKQLAEGVYIGNAMIEINNGFSKIPILNINDTEINIYDLELDIDDFENYDMLFEENINLKNNDRKTQIINNIRVDHLNDQEKNSIINLCVQFQDIFHLKGDKLSTTDKIQHKINIPSETPPINLKPYRIPYSQLEIIDTEIKKLIENEIIAPSDSPFNSPIILVPKKLDASNEKKFRLVVDFRKLNEKTQSEIFPLPAIDQILNQLGNSTYFSILDLASGFHQITLDKDSQPKTAFSTPNNHYEFLKMPMGLKNAPSTFQKLMNSVLAGLQTSQCFVYLDDIIVFGKNLEDHNKKLRNVFDRLQKNKLKLQPDKCEFLRREVTFLGHVICEDGVKPDPSKLEAIKNFPTPKNLKEIQSFLGLTGYYRKFINNYSKLALPLTNSLRKDENFKWSELEQNSFENLKNKLLTPPILIYPNFDREFILTTDASSYAVGAILSQKLDGRDHPIAYASRKLNKAESNYSTIEKELLAIIWAIKHFRPYLYGKHFKIFTDHKPLKYLFNIKDPSSRLIRWRLLLQEYEFEIYHKPGSTIPHVDALSRINIINNYSKSYNKYLEDKSKILIFNKKVIDQQKNFSQVPKDFNIISFITNNLEFISKFNEITKIDKKIFDSRQSKIPRLLYIQHDNLYKIFLTISQSKHKFNYENIFESLENLKEFCLQNKITKLVIPIFSNQIIEENELKTMIRYIFRQTSIVITLLNPANQINYSQEKIKTILKEFHDNPLGGHLGYKRMTKKIKLYHYWKNMTKDIKNYVNECALCQKNKISRYTKMPMEITTTSEKPFDKIFLDIVGPFPISNKGNRYILTLQDDLSKYIAGIPIPNQEVSTIAKKLVTQIICIYGVPKIIVTDQGSNFTSQLFKDVCKILKIKKLNSSAYHPQTNGSLERVHRTLKEYLRNFVSNDNQDWCNWIPYATFVYNTTPNQSTGFTPFELVFGRQANLPNSFYEEPQPYYNYENYYFELRDKMQKCNKIAKENLIHTKEKSKVFYDKNLNIFVPKLNQLVLLKNVSFQKGKSRKLQPLWTGPYKVIKLNSKVNSTILVKNKKMIVHNNRIKAFNKKI